MSALVKRAVAALNVATSNSYKDKLEAIIHPLLKRQQPTQLPDALKAFFSEHLIPLLDLHPQKTLAFSAAIISLVFSKFVKSASASTSEPWQDAIDLGILEGLSAYLQKSNSARRLAGQELYSVLCPLLHSPVFNLLLPTLQRQICVLLTDSATNQQENKIDLWKKDLLGGYTAFTSTLTSALSYNLFPRSRIGALLAGTTDYITLEAILELTICLAPRASKGDQLIQYANDMFSNPLCIDSFGAEGCQALIEALSCQIADRSELSLNMMRILARNDINHPQEFKLHKAVVMSQDIDFADGQNQLWIDQSSFNFAVKDHENEGTTFAVPIKLSSVVQARISPSSIGNTSIICLTLHLSSIPKFAQSLPKQDNENEPASASLNLDHTALPHLRTTLRNRRVPIQDRTMAADLPPLAGKASQPVSVLRFPPRDPKHSMEKAIQGYEPILKHVMPSDDDLSRPWELEGDSSSARVPASTRAVQTHQPSAATELPPRPVASLKQESNIGPANFAGREGVTCRADVAKAALRRIISPDNHSPELTASPPRKRKLESCLIQSPEQEDNELSPPKKTRETVVKSHTRESPLHKARILPPTTQGSTKQVPVTSHFDPLPEELLCNHTTGPSENRTSLDVVDAAVWSPASKPHRPDYVVPSLPVKEEEAYPFKTTSGFEKNASLSPAKVQRKIPKKPCDEPPWLDSDTSTPKNSRLEIGSQIPLPFSSNSGAHPRHAREDPNIIDYHRPLTAENEDLLSPRQVTTVALRHTSPTEPSERELHTQSPPPPRNIASLKPKDQKMRTGATPSPVSPEGALSMQPRMDYARSAGLYQVRREGDSHADSTLAHNPRPFVTFASQPFVHSLLKSPVTRPGPYYKAKKTPIGRLTEVNTPGRVSPHMAISPTETKIPSKRLDSSLKDYRHSLVGLRAECDRYSGRSGSNQAKVNFNGKAPKVVEALEAIHKLVVKNMNEKFSGVSNSVMISQASILEHARDDLAPMSGAKCQNLEVGAARSKRIVDTYHLLFRGYDHVASINDEVGTRIEAMIRAHDVEVLGNPARKGALFGDGGANFRALGIDV